MLRKKKVGVWIAFVIVGLMCLGGCRHPSPEKMADRAIDDLTAKLELNAAQQQQLQSVKAELLGKLAEMKKARQSMHEEVLTELQKDVLDQEKLRKMINTRKIEMDNVSNIVISRLAQFHSTLSPEQKKKLVEYIKDKEKRYHRCPFNR
ncbi:MAG: Spy/CpxP family protein refolding chaperone [Syntrophales bacterium]|nr:Spy/CpxP family protein refolding chaperone [Syntrophales bacterium]